MSSAEVGTRRAVVRVATESADQVRFALSLVKLRAGARNLFAGAIAATIYDGLRGVILLRDTDAEHNATAIVRSMLESDADITALSKVPDYEKRLLQTTYMEWKKFQTSRIVELEADPSKSEEPAEAKATVVKFDGHIAELNPKKSSSG